jgi:hypothetical protein
MEIIGKSVINNLRFIFQRLRDEIDKLNLEKVELKFFAHSPKLDYVNDIFFVIILFTDTFDYGEVYLVK